MITLNAVAAAHAVNDFLFDFLNLRVNSSEAAYLHFHFLNSVTQRVSPRRDPDCSECNRRFGMGDSMKLPTMEG